MDAATAVAAAAAASIKTDIKLLCHKTQRATVAANLAYNCRARFKLQKNAILRNYILYMYIAIVLHEHDECIRNAAIPP